MTVFSKLSLAAATGAMMLSAGCMQTLQDPNNPNRNAQQAAIAGGLMGAAIGAAAADNNPGARTRGILLGAAIGAGAGGLVGHQLDRQEAELRAQMGSNVGITNTGQQLIVTMPQDILFATDSATVSGRLQADLRTLAASLNRHPGSSVNVVGHTDNVGDAGYNQTLSQRRAQAVASVLIGAGVAPGRINAIGRGEDMAIASNLTPAGRAQNRRVEIVITPQG